MIDFHSEKFRRVNVNWLGTSNSADLGGSSNQKNEILFRLKQKKVPEEEQFVQGEPILKDSLNTKTNERDYFGG